MHVTCQCTHVCMLHNRGIQMSKLYVVGAVNEAFTVQTSVSLIYKQLNVNTVHRMMGALLSREDLHACIKIVIIEPSNFTEMLC